MIADIFAGPSIEGSVNSGVSISGDVHGSAILGVNLGTQITSTRIDMPPATTERLGGIVVTDDFTVTEHGALFINKATEVSEDNTRPITAAAVYMEVGNINALLEAI